MKRQNTKRCFLLLIWFVVLLLTASCSGITQDASSSVEPTSTQTPTPKPTSAPLCVTPNSGQIDSSELGWWNDVVFYEIFVRSFYDSDGDGIGDFNGIVEKLDYLNDGDSTTTDDLGITGIWLMPINPSPSYHGYDVMDYFAVNEEYGTMEDFQNLLDEAHQRGIKVIIDMVLNHTSSHHPWFQEASTNSDSPYRDYYIWEDPAPSFDSPWGTDVWYRIDTGSYYAIFWAGMPDLNYTNPKVTEEMQEVIRFWLEDVGVDGFRLDAIKHLIEEGEIQENTLATHKWWEGFYDYYNSINPEAFTVGEAWSSTSEVLKYIGDEVNIAFEFNTAGAILKSARLGSKQYISEAHQLITRSYPPHQYATFITNHDQPRVMSELMRNIGQAKTAASLLLTGPGVPFLYYGEEVGQTGRKPDENIRTPMQWSDGTNAGFTTASLPWKSPQGDYKDWNVATQTGDADSLLSQYRALIHARNEYPALRIGNLLELPTSERGLYAFLRYTTDQTLLVLINMSDKPIRDYRFCLSEGDLEIGTAHEILWGLEVSSPDLNNNGGFDNYQPLEELEAYTTYIIELK